MTWKLYAVVSAGAFVATYLVSSPPVSAPPPSAASPTRPAARPTAGSDIQQLADRLQARVRSEIEYREPARDPFHFAPPRATRPVTSSAPSVVEAPPPPAAVPVLPNVTLSGVATDVVDGSPKRTAVLSTPAGVLMLREGDSVGGLYRVIAIAEDSIELEATADGSRRTLRLGR